MRSRHPPCTRPRCQAIGSLSSSRCCDSAAHRAPSWHRQIPSTPCARQSAAPSAPASFARASASLAGADLFPLPAAQAFERIEAAHTSQCRRPASDPASACTPGAHRAAIPPITRTTPAARKGRPCWQGGGRALFGAQVNLKPSKKAGLHVSERAPAARPCAKRAFW